MNSTFKPALLLMGGRMVAFAATFFIPVVLVRVFDQTEFGTYKQLFLVYATLFGILQFGMAESLYYFLPLGHRKGGRYTANALVSLAGAGIVGLALVVWKAPLIASWLGNGALAAYLPALGVYVLLSVLSVTLEIIMTSRQQFFTTAASYAISEIVRAAAFIVPVLLTRQLEWLLVGVIAFAAARLAATVIYVFHEFGRDVFPHAAALREQLVYALPFFGSSLLADWASQFHQYAVSHYFDTATFAIYAVGCMNIPLVELVHSPVGNVMMVRMAEYVKDRDDDAVLAIWNDTTRKLALVFFPMLGFLLVSAREVIVFLFTSNYLASVPIFMIWSISVLLPVLQTDAVLRVYAETRFLLYASAFKLAASVVFILAFIRLFDVWGAALITLIVSFATKFICVARFKHIAKVTLPELLPWKSLAANAGVTAAAYAVTLLIKSQLQARTLVILMVTGTVFGVTYAILALLAGVISSDERQALVDSLQRIPVRLAKVGALLKD
ncbi:MAG TPA: oligosaccharide flippase family protein [Candidatus Binatia bacterium]|jgi:O-antigen/teichoic acid export membrane protein